MAAIRNRTHVTTARQQLQESGISEGQLCCRGIPLELGDAEQKWYGLFPPDRMHCWYATHSGSQMQNANLLSVKVGGHRKTHVAVADINDRYE